MKLSFLLIVVFLLNASKVNAKPIQGCVTFETFFVEKLALNRQQAHQAFDLLAAKPEAERNKIIAGLQRLPPIGHWESILFYWFKKNPVEVLREAFDVLGNRDHQELISDAVSGRHPMNKAERQAALILMGVHYGKIRYADGLLKRLNWLGENIKNPIGAWIARSIRKKTGVNETVYMTGRSLGLIEFRSELLKNSYNDVAADFATLLAKIEKEANGEITLNAIRSGLEARHKDLTETLRAKQPRGLARSYVATKIFETRALLEIMELAEKDPKGWEKVYHELSEAMGYRARLEVRNWRAIALVLYYGILATNMWEGLEAMGPAAIKQEPSYVAKADDFPTKNLLDDARHPELKGRLQELMARIDEIDPITLHSEIEKLQDAYPELKGDIVRLLEDRLK